jgi:glucose-6-phosphate 1-dehydrogenase
LEAWAQEGLQTMPQYPAGSTGPAEADELLARDHRHWRAIAREDGSP